MMKGGIRITMNGCWTGTFALLSELRLAHLPKLVMACVVMRIATSAIL